MLTKENLEEILAIATSSGADFAEIFIENKVSTAISCEDNKIEKIISGTDTGAGIRIISGKEMAYTASSDTSFEALKKAAEQASRSISGNAKQKSINLVPRVSNTWQKVKIRPNDVAAGEKIAKVELLNKTARSFGSRIKQVMVGYTDSNQAVTIANSEGNYIEDNRIRIRYYLNVIAEKDGVLQTGIEAPGGTCGFELFERYPPEEYARRAAERALIMLDAPHAPSGKMAVILHSDAGSTLIHEACGHSLEADFIMKGTSVFSGKIGQKVASNIVTVVDDATHPGNFGSYSFDDEGTPAQRTVLIENGMLKSFMSDRFTAQQIGMVSSGNGRREDFRHKPVPRMTNTMIVPGTMDPQEIIASVKNGLLVKHMGGGEVNVTNGDFVFEVNEGYLIENGGIKHPVRGAILTGNGPKTLEIIDMVGTDLGFQTGICGKFDHVPVSHGQPTIRVPEIIVGGRI